MEDHFFKRKIRAQKKKNDVKNGGSFSQNDNPMIRSTRYIEKKLKRTKTTRKIQKRAKLTLIFKSKGVQGNSKSHFLMSYKNWKRHFKSQFEGNSWNSFWVLLLHAAVIFAK